MAPKGQLGDRREHVRLHVTGQLWAALDLSARVVVRNIGTGGALVEVRLAPDLRSVRAAQISLRAQSPPLNVVVRHVSPLPAASGGDRYLVGLEFLHLSPAGQAEVGQLVREWNGEVEE